MFSVDYIIAYSWKCSTVFGKLNITFVNGVINVWTFSILHPYTPQIFDIAKPGCQGRIDESDIKYVSQEQLEEIHAYMKQVEDEYWGINVEEEEEEGEEEGEEEEYTIEDIHKLFGDMDIPDFTVTFDTEEDSDEDDGSHIKVDQVYTADSADEGQDGGEGEPAEGTAGHIIHAASSDHKPSDHSTREELWVMISTLYNYHALNELLIASSIRRF